MILNKQLINKVIAVDIGGTNLRVARVRRDGSITAKQSVATPKSGKDSSIVSKEIIRLIRLILSPNEPVPIISISSAGPLDLRRGIIDHCPNIPLGEVPLVTPLQEAFQSPVFLFKDTHAGVLGEKFFGGGKDIANFVYITISTGIGGGAIVNNHLLIGRNGNAGEIGRFFVSENEPYFWNSCASGAFLLATFEAFCKKQDLSCTYHHAKDIFEAARQKEPHAILFMEELGRINGRGLSDVIVAYDPEKIVFGGSVILHNQDCLFPAMLRHVDNYLTLPEIKVTTLGDDISLLGAAAGIFFRGKY
jgi:glucokinase